ncbi:DUF2293 domain-containing protein [Nocardiopsis gilva YIM 90087]|uniref:DUF2293 domain-containing protein n=1 Tax=Nocardiopsis gilva YIM 90087 TaxID=1235441 RepID=A0A223S7W1_9ACTN|nr:DUF2293 domain-containing protein [Nocardiopsis gilva]ASU84205.1 DUF2293 domain-containing protein [Nocardiopsis gilva YIM 90087]
MHKESPDNDLHTTKLGQRVAAAAQEAVARRGSVSPVDVLTGIGWLSGNQVDAWHQGRIDHLEQAVQVPPDKLARAAALLRAWAREHGLNAEEASYAAATRDRRELRFTAEGDPALERAYRTHWLAPDLTEAQRRRIEQKRATAPDLMVVVADGDWSCAECGDGGADGGDLFLLEDGQRICLLCAEMDHLVLLPSGNATLTRRAKKASGLSAVTVRWDRRRKRYQRRGILVEATALERAEEQCLADEDLRARRRERDAVRRAEQDVELEARITKEILCQFPGCPEERAQRIARHTATRGSGRVGRSAAGREVEPKAVRRAVVASVRHEETGYDAMLMAGVAREEARARIADDIDRVLAGWSSPA